jgi:xanthine dehydrogenase accessory factor
MRVANSIRILVRGGGDLASGAIIRLARAGFLVLVLELPQPLAVRRLVSFAQAVYDGEIQIEEKWARRAASAEEAWKLFSEGVVAVMVDPAGVSAEWFYPDVILDARMLKADIENQAAGDPFLIGLGPGFKVGKNCTAVVETMRGPFLGRVFWEGSAEEDTGIPEKVGLEQSNRVIRSLDDGIFQSNVHIGDHLMLGQIIGRVGDSPIAAPFEGILRGLIQDRLWVTKGLKIGDLDPRLDPRICRLVSDKALAVGGGVLEAILVHLSAQKKLWNEKTGHRGNRFGGRPVPSNGATKNDTHLGPNDGYRPGDLCTIGCRC